MLLHKCGEKATKKSKTDDEEQWARLWAVSEELVGLGRQGDD